MFWCDHQHTNNDWKLLRKTNVDHVVLVISHELMDCNLHVIHTLALKLQQAWNASTCTPVKELLDGLSSAVEEDQINTGGSADMTRGGTLADPLSPKGRAAADRKKNKKSAGHLTFAKGDKDSEQESAANETTSFSCVSTQQFLQSLPLTTKMFHKSVRTHAQTVRDQLLRGWLAYGREKFAIDAQVVPTTSELAADTTGILRAQMERLEAANEQRKLDPRNGGTGMNSATALSKTNSKKSMQKKKTSPMIESIDDLRRRYEALDEDPQEGDGLLGFTNQETGGGHMGGQTREVEQWVEALPDLKSGITGTSKRRYDSGSDEVNQVMSLTEIVLEHPEVVKRTAPEQGAMISKTLKERRRELLRASTTLMSRQLRSMMDSSVESFVSYFEQRWRNDTPSDKAVEEKRLSEISLHMATDIALDGLRLDVNEDDTADIMLPPTRSMSNNDNNNDDITTTTMDTTPITATTRYPNGLLPFTPRSLKNGYLLQTRQTSKCAIVIACLAHAFSEEKPEHEEQQDQENIFQKKLLTLSTPCNNSILTTFLTVSDGTSDDHDSKHSFSSGSGSDDDKKFILKPSLSEIENILCNDILEEFRLAIYEFPTPHSERDTKIEYHERAVALKKNELTQKFNMLNNNINNPTQNNSLLLSSKTKKKKKKKKMKAEIQQLFMETCTYSSDHESVLTNARRRILHILQTNQEGPKALEKRFAKYEWIFSNKEENKLNSLLKKISLASISSTKILGEIDSANDPGSLIDAFDVMVIKRNGLLGQTKKYIRQYQKIRKTINRSIYNTHENIEHYPIYSIDCRQFMTQIQERLQGLINHLLSGIASSCLAHMQRICSSFEQIGAKLVREPTDAAELKKLQLYSESCVFDIETLEKTMMVEPLNKFQFLVKYGYTATKEEIGAISMTLG